MSNRHSSKQWVKKQERETVPPPPKSHDNIHCAYKASHCCKIDRQILNGTRYGLVDGRILLVSYTKIQCHQGHPPLPTHHAPVTPYPPPAAGTDGKAQSRSVRSTYSAYRSRVPFHKRYEERQAQAQIKKGGRPIKKVILDSNWANHAGP